MSLERDKPEHQEVKGIHYFRSINLWVSFPATLPFQVLTLIGVAWAGGNNRDGLCSQVKKTLPQLCVMDMSDQTEIIFCQRLTPIVQDLQVELSVDLLVNPDSSSDLTPSASVFFAA